MNISAKKIVFASIEDQWLKGENDLVMGYANKTFVELMYWLYIHYGRITPVNLTKNKYTMQTSYHVKELTEIIFNQI